MQSIGLYIIGDEILSGKRQDAHLTKVIDLLSARGMQLSWAHFLGDVPSQITALFRDSMARGDVVFSFGGIGATPDDFTRQCAADAANVPIARHVEAESFIINRYGDDAFPKRVLMADFPKGASIIPNPVNQIAGFSINEHHFVPGFPDMGHPMVEWVLQTYYQALFHQQDYIESSIIVNDAPESDLIDLMNTLLAQYPSLKVFSLPKTQARRTVELGIKGDSALVKTAMSDLKNGVTALGFSWDALPSP